MFDVWMGVELTTFVLIFSAAVLLPIQFLLCFKVKKKAIRLFPIVVLFILMFIFVVMAVAVDGWDSLGYLFLAIFTGLMLIACGMGLGYLDDFPFSEKEINIGSNGFDLLEGLSLVLYKEKIRYGF